MIILEMSVECPISVEVIVARIVLPDTGFR